MRDRSPRWLRQAAFGLWLVIFGTTAWAEKERCVAGPDGEWLCGKNITDADAAPLPDRTQRSTPPILLIDPRRFGEMDRQPTTAANVAPPESALSSEPKTPANQTAVEPETTEATHAPARATTPAVAPDLDFSPPSRGFAVQLAAASSPRGFGALLAKLGQRGSNFQQRQLRNGTWVLLLGNFPTLEAARAAIPSAVPGAFARNLADLSFN